MSLPPDLTRLCRLFPNHAAGITAVSPQGTFRFPGGDAPTASVLGWATTTVPIPLRIVHLFPFKFVMTHSFPIYIHMPERKLGTPAI